MSTVESKVLTDYFLAFASQASQILHIRTNEDYEDALELIEYLFDLAEDSENDPLNDLITIISKSIEEYESDQEELVNFELKAETMNPNMSMLRTIMTQFRTDDVYNPVLNVFSRSQANKILHKRG